MKFAVCIMSAVSVWPIANGAEPTAEWTRHTIDASSRGADGVRLADANGDGRPDIATGWEQDGIVRLYLHPGAEKVKYNWPAVTIGSVDGPEDAVLVDLDRDGALDVVSCCEGKHPSVNVHWSPAAAKQQLHQDRWHTRPIPAASPGRRWMFAAPMNIDGRHGMDLVLGAKDGGAELGWLQAPADARRIEGWTWHPLSKIGWIMSIVPSDMDGDGDLDIVFSDRKGAERGCYWLENTGPARAGEQAWDRHLIGGRGKEVMFLHVADLDGDGRQDVLCAVRGDGIHYLRRTNDDPPAWDEHVIAMPSGTGTGKAISVGDINGDDRQDVVFTCENAVDKQGVMWLSWETSPLQTEWSAHPISGDEQGIKFDLVELIDLDEDGDLDVLTCEERDNLGVIWYENPSAGL